MTIFNREYRESFLARPSYESCVASLQRLESDMWRCGATTALLGRKAALEARIQFYVGLHDGHVDLFKLELRRLDTEETLSDYLALCARLGVQPEGV